MSEITMVFIFGMIQTIVLVVSLTAIVRTVKAATGSIEAVALNAMRSIAEEPQSVAELLDGMVTIYEENHKMYEEIENMEIAMDDLSAKFVKKFPDTKNVVATQTQTVFPRVMQGNGQVIGRK